MVKIFAKLIKNHKTIKSYTYSNIKEYESVDFYSHLSEISRKLDIPTPIVIDYHRECYENFNSVKFSKADFVDKQPFDFMLIENIDLWIIFKKLRNIISGGNLWRLQVLLHLS